MLKIKIHFLRAQRCASASTITVARVCLSVTTGCSIETDVWIELFFCTESSLDLSYWNNISEYCRIYPQLVKLMLAWTIVVQQYWWRSMIFEEKWHYSEIYVKSRFHCLIDWINFGRVVHRWQYWLKPRLQQHLLSSGMIKKIYCGQLPCLR